MDNQVLTVLEMAGLLRISRSKAYKLIKDTTFPSVKIGKSVRIYKKELESWLHNAKNMI